MKNEKADIVQIMAGPYDFGTTKTLQGTWRILHKLHIIMEWGTSTYEAWFNENVLKWARRTNGTLEEEMPKVQKKNKKGKK